MKQLKLEVGKTYRSRDGEEVRIVGKDDGVPYPYTGDDDEWYAENGQWSYDSEEDPRDLIEELPEPRYAFITPDDMKKVTAHRYTFTIPEGTKGVNVSKEGNRIIVEMVPEAKEPKPGDVMINKQGNVYIFKSVVNSDTHAHCSWLGKSGSLAIAGTCHPGRPATPEEAQPLWDALKKAGKRWNPETMQVEEIPERERIMAFLQGYANKVTWDYRQLCLLIEAYLKRREESEKA